MTETSAIQPSLASSPAATKKSASDAAATLSSDFETFLKMMTAQVQNQDPLNPMDSTEYASQLATFSSVEQQVLTNDLLKEMGAMLGGNDLQKYGSWVGMEALAKTPSYFSGDPVAIRPDYAEDADNAVLQVRNSEGDIVQSLPVPVGQKEVLWAGYDDNLAPFPNGIYSFEIDSYKDDELIETKLSSVYNQVEEVRNNGASVALILAGGTAIETTQVDGLRSSL
ncbi:MAG: flagellar hook capping FlgD N-terminal domain-containing protein [Pelagimonas sp.]|uniref:flagellar hook capping FlgD N-terminal domain-containing protein n=1 Tax=Pelagimonas sp. TaxID=2073170 RepID=UPI003D6AEF81